MSVKKEKTGIIQHIVHRFKNLITKARALTDSAYALLDKYYTHVIVMTGVWFCFGKLMFYIIDGFHAVKIPEKKYETINGLQEMTREMVHYLRVMGVWDNVFYMWDSLWLPMVFLSLSINKFFFYVWLPVVIFTLIRIPVLAVQLSTSGTTLDLPFISGMLFVLMNIVCILITFILKKNVTKIN